MKRIYFTLTRKTILVILLFTYATALSPFIDANFRNYLVIIVTVLFVPMLFLRSSRIDREILLVALPILYSCLVTLLNGTTDDVVTLTYTGLFATGYLIVLSTLQSPFLTAKDIEVFLARLIKLYAIVAVAQLITSMTNLPVPNQLGTKGLWSYNSLATEPSYVGRVISLTLLAYLIIGRMSGRPRSLLAMIKSRKGVFLAFCVAVILSGSSLALLAAVVAVLLSVSTGWFLAISASLVLLWPALFSIDVESVQRLLAFLIALPSADLNELIEADTSGALRIASLLIYIDQLDINNVGFWFGQGISGLAFHFEGRIPGLDNGIMAGFIPGYIVAFGLFGTTLFLWVFVVRFLNESTVPLIILIGVFYSTMGWNTQVFWYGLMIVRVVYHLSSPRHQISTLRYLPAVPPIPSREALEPNQV